jgi:hypothetical protein
MLHVELRADALEQVLGGMTDFPAGSARAWPRDQPVEPLMDARIFGTLFDDAPLYHAPLIERIVAQAATQPPNVRGSGGKKVRDLETWGSPPAELLSLRALLLFCLTQNVREAHVTDRWANVMERGEYSAPHAHYAADGSVVYFLDPGERDAVSPDDGAFVLMDSRVPFCCSIMPERPTRGLMPEMVPGTMILFPAEFLHFVNPYAGDRPRITLAWNICGGPPPPEGLPDMTQQTPIWLRRM